MVLYKSRISLENNKRNDLNEVVILFLTFCKMNFKLLFSKLKENFRVLDIGV